MNEQLTLRRKTAIEQLEKQLKDGTKPTKRKDTPKGYTYTSYKKAVPRLPLEPKDIKRIKKTISLLNAKLAN